jgi:blue light- and temperature-responsive anti-repressor
VAAAFNATFAFQPIVDVESRTVFAYEALVRGRSGESAGQILGALTGGPLHDFDRDARVSAIGLAASLGLTQRLSLNFLPETLESSSDSISSTLEAAARHSITPEQLILEITEGEIVQELEEFAAQINSFKSTGLRLAIDDFGAGYAGLNLLAEFQPDIVKLDMNLVRDIDSKGPRQAIARAVIQACADLGLEIIAEGVETEGELAWFRRQGIRLFQGYYFARPAFERLEQPSL